MFLRLVITRSTPDFQSLLTRAGLSHNDGIEKIKKCKNTHCDYNAPTLFRLSQLKPQLGTPWRLHSGSENHKYRLIWLPPNEKRKPQSWRCHRGSAIPTKTLEGDKSCALQRICCLASRCALSPVLGTLWFSKQIWTLQHPPLPGIGFPVQFMSLCFSQ